MDFSASMMCARYENLQEEVALLDGAGIDSYHIDIMDGVFVPNLGMGLQDIMCIRRLTKAPIEAHLMVKNVRAYINVLRKVPVDTIYIHPEADIHPFAAFQAIADEGIRPGIAIGPGVTIETVRELFNIAKAVLVMAVTPGFAGQSFLPYVVPKIGQLAQIKDAYGLRLYWDGNCTWDKIEEHSKTGIDGFVLGTNVLFSQTQSYKEIVGRARALCQTGAGNR